MKKTFCREQRLVELLKLKASYGSVGSQGIGNYTSRELLSATVYNGVGGLVLIIFNVADMERKLMFNTALNFPCGRAALEVALNTITIRQRICSSTDNYPALPVFLPLPTISKLQNQGIEVSLNATIIKTRNFSWK